MFPELEAERFTPGPHRIALHGYPRLLDALSRAAQGGRVAHAYLLAGPPSVGKRQAARFFAQALLCPAEPSGNRPCGHCRTCRLVVQDGLADLHWSEVPLKVERARELQGDLALAPVEGLRRVAVLPEIELATPSAANSLLKTLEEPPAHTVLILTTAQPSEVLPTIHSRCQVFAMRPLAPAMVSGALESHWSAEPSTADLLARLSGGRLGWAVRALSDDTMLEARDRWLDGLVEVLDADRVVRFARAEVLAKDKVELTRGLAYWIGWWRDLLLLSYGVESALVNRDRLDGLQRARMRFAVDEIAAALRAVEEALRRLRQNTNPRLTLEVLLLELPI